jgi:hypothetical protein
MTAARARLLRAVVRSALVRQDEPELQLLPGRLGLVAWRQSGRSRHGAGGLGRSAHDLRGSGLGDKLLPESASRTPSSAGTAQESTPWRVAQRAAWAALR